jgi:hypothetical protein
VTRTWLIHGKGTRTSATRAIRRPASFRFSGRIHGTVAEPEEESPVSPLEVKHVEVFGKTMAEIFTRLRLGAWGGDGVVDFAIELAERGDTKKAYLILRKALGARPIWPASPSCM